MRFVVQRFLAIVTAGISILAVSACGGPGGAGGAGGGVGGPAWIFDSAAGNFNSVTAENLRLSAQFQYSNYNITQFGAYAGLIANPAHAYEVTRLHIARSGGLSGSGQLIAIADDGFRTTHEQFTGKTIRTYGNVSVAGGSSHGTFVASVAAGSSVFGLTLGVAPGADLHLTSTLDDATRANLDLTKLTAATLNASALGAVAQNNSWGLLKNGAHGGGELLLSDVQTYMTNNGVSAFGALTNLVGSPSGIWSNYYSALNTFQNTGTIVVAISNDDTLTSSDFTAAAPVVLPNLAEAWITVGNGAFSLDATGHITNAVRLSSPCAQTASFCLFADGTLVSAGAGSDTQYAAWTGTSFAAPQVAGGLALIAEAFPSLNASERTKRLLASANNNFTAFSRDGTTDFGNGVQRYYSNEWGQGVMDLEAALSPIGTVSLVNGRNVNTGTREAVTGSYVYAGSGDALMNVLSGHQITVFDALNANFEMPAESLVRMAPRTTKLQALPKIDALAPTQNDAAQRLSGHMVGVSPIDGNLTLQAGMGLSSSTVDDASILSLAGATTAITNSFDTPFGRFEQFGFTGVHKGVIDGNLSGVGGSFSFDAGSATLKFGTSLMAETGAYLGMMSSDMFGVPDAAGIQTLNMSLTQKLTDNLTFFGGYEHGATLDALGTGLVDQVSNVTFSGFQVGLKAQNVFTKSDDLSLTLSQPMRMESGEMSMSIPVGRTQDGTILYENVTGSLSPSGRQLDLGIAYKFRPGSNSVAQFGFTYSSDAGHVSGAKSALVTGAYHQKF